MSTQNDWLSEYFGDEIAEDLEKTAQAHLLTKMAEQHNIDINQLSDEDIQALLTQLLGNLDQHPEAQVNQMQGHGTSQAPNAQMPTTGNTSPNITQNMAKEAQARLEEADTLGRVMAHAYTDELQKIAGVSAGGTPRSIKGAIGNMALKAKMKGRAHMQDHGKKYLGGAAIAGAGALAGRASKKEKNASSLAFEKLANDRAIEILNTLGIGQDQESAQEPAQEDVSFDQAVDTRALQMLAEAGYDPSQVAAAYDQTMEQATNANPQ